MELPLWLQENEPSLCNCGCLGVRKKQGFLQKTIRDILSFLRDSVFSEAIANEQGYLQKLDPRVKLGILLFTLVVINVLTHLALLWGLYLIILVIAAFSGLKPGFILKRVWLVVPLFTGIMVIPALFNWVRGGDPLLILWNFGHPLQVGPFKLPDVLTITKQGFWGALLLISRVGISVSLAAIITLTTRWTDLLRALRALFVPKIFVVTLEMTYRYIFVFLNILEEMFLARKARDAGQSSTSEQRRFVASSMASLFGKTLQMSEEVYSSMVARGYTGEIYTVQRFRLHWYDVFVFGVVILAGLTLFAGDKIF